MDPMVLLKIFNEFCPLVIFSDMVTRDSLDFEELAVNSCMVAKIDASLLLSAIIE